MSKIGMRGFYVLRDEDGLPVMLTVTRPEGEAIRAQFRLGFLELKAKGWTLGPEQWIASPKGFRSDCFEAAGKETP